MLGEQVLHHVRRLRALIDGQALLAFVPVGDDGARLGGDAGVAAENEGGLDHGVGFGEGLVGRADFQLAFEAEIVAELGLDHRRLGIERGFRIGDRRQRLVVRPRPVRRHLRLARACARPRRRPLRPASRRGRRRSAYCGADFRPFRCVSTPTQGVITLASSAPVTTAMTPGAFFAASASIEDNFRVRVRRAHEGDMRHARQRNVADILPAPLREPLQIRPRHRAADIGIRPVERGQYGRGVVGDFHFLLPRALAPPLPPHRRWRDSRCSGSNCRRCVRGFRRGSAPCRASTIPARRRACRACNSRIAARCAARRPPADRQFRRSPTGPRWSRTPAPSHCTASIRQPRTISPLTRTVQAPQTPCSQPTWLPVRPRSSRRKSTSVLRASTRSETGSPLTVREMSSARSISAPP